MGMKRVVDISKTEMLQHVQDGKTDQEIADIHFCSESTVQRIRSEYGIGRYIQVYDKQMYLRMKELGLSDEQVSHIWGCSRRVLVSWKSRVGLSKRRNSSSEAYV